MGEEVTILPLAAPWVRGMGSSFDLSFLVYMASNTYASVVAI